MAKTPEIAVRRVSVILGAGGASRDLLELLLPLLGKERDVEMKGVFIEEADVRYAAELPFVKELCRVTFSVREFDHEQFERDLALRMRTARRAIAVLARRAGVTHSFQNLRGSAIRLVRETAKESDITVFEPSRMKAAPMAIRPPGRLLEPRILVAIDDLAAGKRALTVARGLCEGRMDRVGVLLSPALAGDNELQDHLFGDAIRDRPGRVTGLPEGGIHHLIDAVRAAGATLLVLAVDENGVDNEVLVALRSRLRCPVCLVQHWRDDPEVGDATA